MNRPTKKSNPARLRRCPKCRSVNVNWVETTNAHASFEQTAAGISPEGIQSYGLITGVMGECRECRHTWKPTNVRMVTHLPGHPDYEPRKAPTFKLAKPGQPGKL